MSMTLKDINDKLRKIDICMMTTQTGRGALESRPMSNNKDVDFDGDCYFFTDGDSTAAKQIASHPQVNLGFSSSGGLFGGGGTFISLTGPASLSTDKATMKKHWNKDIEVWFKDGIETPGLTLIHVKASRLKYWQNGDEGEIKLN
ncbi:MAG: pyridoxamine 5'-phosphate oxidase family protein [Pseudomonadota bacterium]